MSRGKTKLKQKLQAVPDMRSKLTTCGTVAWFGGDLTVEPQRLTSVWNPWNGGHMEVDVEHSDSHPQQRILLQHVSHDKHEMVV